MLLVCPDYITLFGTGGVDMQNEQIGETSIRQNTRNSPGRLQETAPYFLLGIFNLANLYFANLGRFFDNSQPIWMRLRQSERA